jgi:hypothetical protein
MSETMRTPVTDSSAWTRKNLEQDRSWIIALSAEHAGEIDAAVDAVRKRGLRPASFGREDFPLPTLSGLLTRALEDLEDGRGVLLLRGLPISGADEEKAAYVIWGLGTYLGKALRQIPRLNLGGYQDNLIAHIADQGLDYNATNVPGSGTSAEQLPHCDASDLVALLCVRRAADGGVSRIVSSMTVYNAILREAPEILEVLYEGYFHDLRGEIAKGSQQELTSRRIPVYSVHKGVLSCNFNAKTIRDAVKKTGSPLSREEGRALDKMLEIAMRPEFQVEMQLETGDLQILNNYTVLHSRTGWRDDPGYKRLMLRLWVKTLGAREIAPEMLGGFLAGALNDVSNARAEG